MPRITPLDALHPGDVLAADVADRSGRLILGRGRTLTERHIEIFRSWGIAQVDLMADGEDEAAAPGSAALKAARAAVLPQFDGLPREHPFVSALIDACAAQHLAAERAGGRQ